MQTRQLPTLDAQRRFWDWHWERATERKVLNEWTTRRGDRVLGLVRSLRIASPRILDFGCGNGWFCERLAALGEVTGVDLSPAAIAEAQSRCPSVRFMAGDFSQLPLPVGGFDVVVSQEVIAHVADQVAYLRRAAAALRPGGYLVLATANRFVMDRVGDLGWTRHPAEHIAHYPDRRDLKRLLRPYFRVLGIRSIIPVGQQGVLRVVNSYKLNTALACVIPRRWLEALKERAGLGYQLIALAQRRA